MNVAVFADIHGRIFLAFKLCARWEQETGEKLDLILQAGDMGIYPHRDRLDRATLRYAQKDPTELGFMQNFVEHDDEVAAVLAQTKCNLVFVRGNHEDHAWLDSLESQTSDTLFPVDVYRRIYCLKTGMPYTDTKNNAHLSVLGIGRVGQHGPTLRDTNIQPYEQARLKGAGDIAVDVLLTHDMPGLAMSDGVGMAEIGLALKQNRPAYHFYGHIGGECRSGIAENGLTQYCKLADLEWRGAQQIVHPGSMAILRWQDRSRHTLNIVRDGWYNEYTTDSWQSL